jgi:DNA-binding FadR family transcriptional regulator
VARSANQAAPTSALPERAASSKRAALVADRIVGEVAAQGWPVGEVIGSEQDLLERYGVSRAVLREAIRLLEHLQVARMRRGPGGGLVVTEPTLDSVTDAVSVYLYYVGAEIDEVVDARLALEETAAELAPDRLEESDIVALRDLAERERAGRARDHRELHRLVADISGNPALAFFVEMLNRATLLYLPDRPTFSRQTLGDSHVAHDAIIRAILSGDGGTARRRMRKHLRAEAEYLKARRPSRRRLADLPAMGDRSEKRAEQTARRIFHEVTKANWQVGALLGSEAELMERYDVSRAVLREAVRVLEHHQVARMRRGPGGGLFVAEPGVEAVSEACALQIDRRGIKPAHLFELRTAVELVMLQLVIGRLDDTGVAAIRTARQSERSADRAEFGVVGHDFHAVLAGLAGNRVIELLVLVLVRLTRFHAVAPPDAPEPMPTGDVIHVHDRIADAVADRDVELAKHRMRRHLNAMQHWSR